MTVLASGLRFSGRDLKADRWPNVELAATQPLTECFQLSELLMRIFLFAECSSEHDENNRCKKQQRGRNYVQDQITHAVLSDLTARYVRPVMNMRLRAIQVPDLVAVTRRTEHRLNLPGGLASIK